MITCILPFHCISCCRWNGNGGNGRTRGTLPVGRWRKRSVSSCWLGKSASSRRGLQLCINMHLGQNRLLCSSVVLAESSVSSSYISHVHRAYISDSGLLCYLFRVLWCTYGLIQKLCWKKWFWAPFNKIFYFWFLIILFLILCSFQELFALNFLHEYSLELHQLTTFKISVLVNKFRMARVFCLRFKRIQIMSEF